MNRSWRLFPDSLNLCKHPMCNVETHDFVAGCNLTYAATRCFLDISLKHLACFRWCFLPFTQIFLGGEDHIQVDNHIYCQAVGQEKHHWGVQCIAGYAVNNIPQCRGQKKQAISESWFLILTFLGGGTSHWTSRSLQRANFQDQIGSSWEFGVSSDEASKILWHPIVRGDMFPWNWNFADGYWSSSRWFHAFSSLNKLCF